MVEIFTYLSQHLATDYVRLDDTAVGTPVEPLPDDAAAVEHARQRLLGLGPEWISIVVAGGPEEALAFMGAWDRKDGSIQWAPVTL